MLKEEVGRGVCVCGGRGGGEMGWGGVVVKSGGVAVAEVLSECSSC